MIKAMCDLHAGKLKRDCRIAGIILSGGLMPKDWTKGFLEKSGIPTLAAKEDTYSVASRVHSMVVKLKPQDEYKIKLIVDMVERHVDIGKVLACIK
jgi:BioD-like phosphotransacetylase family protein